jgi:hypothetical protein
MIYALDRRWSARVRSSGQRKALEGSRRYADQRWHPAAYGDARARWAPLRLRRWCWDRTSVASRIHWISFGDLRHRWRNDIGCVGVSSMRAFRPPCQRTGAPVWDSQWPGRRNLPRRGTPRRAPVRADEPDDDGLTYVHVTCLACAQTSGEPEDQKGPGRRGRKDARGAMRSYNARQDHTEPSPFQVRS